MSTRTELQERFPWAQPSFFPSSKSTCFLAFPLKKFAPITLFQTLLQEKTYRNLIPPILLWFSYGLGHAMMIDVETWRSTRQCGARGSCWYPTSTSLRHYKSDGFSRVFFTAFGRNCFIARAFDLKHKSLIICLLQTRGILVICHDWLKSEFPMSHWDHEILYSTLEKSVSHGSFIILHLPLPSHPLVYSFMYFCIYDCAAIVPCSQPSRPF